MGDARFAREVSSHEQSCQLSVVSCQIDDVSRAVSSGHFPVICEPGTVGMIPGVGACRGPILSSYLPIFFDSAIEDRDRVFFDSTESLTLRHGCCVRESVFPSGS